MILLELLDNFVGFLYQIAFKLGLVKFKDFRDSEEKK